MRRSSDENVECLAADDANRSADESSDGGEITCTASASGDNPKMRNASRHDERLLGAGIFKNLLMLPDANAALREWSRRGDRRLRSTATGEDDCSSSEAQR